MFFINDFELNALPARHGIIWYGPVSFSSKEKFRNMTSSPRTGRASNARKPGNLQIMLVFINLKIVSGDGVIAFQCSSNSSHPVKGVRLGFIDGIRVTDSIHVQVQRNRTFSLLHRCIESIKTNAIMTKTRSREFALIAHNSQLGYFQFRMR
jgi:hypothetical protein